MVRVLHLASSNRWTGAAAPAFAEVVALREAGVEAHYAYVGGYKLEAKLAGLPFAHPLIEKRQDPFAFARTAKALSRLVKSLQIDLVHAHLTYDHLLATTLRSRSVRIARTYHSARTLRRDPFSMLLTSRTDHLAVINSTFVDAAAIRARKPAFTPPPLDSVQFSPAGPNARALYGLAESPVVGMIGKVAPERGFEEGLRAFAALRAMRDDVKLLIIGHGPHRPTLERLASELGITPAVTWAGYHEDDLAEHLRAMDLFLFTRTGSDEGHRAVLEALGCGVPVVAAPMAGIEALLGPLAPRLLAKAAAPDALASALHGALAGALAPLRDSARQRALQFAYPAAAARLLALYGVAPNAPAGT